MPKYSIAAALTISVHTEVEAESEEKAKAKALSRGVIGLCYQCGGYTSKSKEWVTCGELDGNVEEEDITEVLEMEE